MTFSVVILSARAANLVPCVRAVLANEPALPPDHIIVVDDGARAQAEAQLPGVRWVEGSKPFIFARNANLGIRTAASDVILLNDDARLLTPQGFTLLAQQVQSQPDVGVWSVGVQGVVGNPRQIARQPVRLRLEEQTLAFVCVYIPRAVYDRIGSFDERFTGYGCEDTDYCDRIRAAGLQLGIWDGCVVDHSGALPSTFRTRPDLPALFRHNRELYQLKQVERPSHAGMEKAGEQVTSDRCVDLLYLACNRLEFTQETFTTLIANTDWLYVHELFVYDDGSKDGTREWLEQVISQVPAPTRFVKTNFGSPVLAMCDFIAAAQAPILAKTDNDAMLPPGWLRQSLTVLERHPELMLLGIEAMNPPSADPSVVHSYTPAEFISGLGLYRRSAFARSRPVMYKKYFGLEEWQVAQGPGLVRGWIAPAIPVFLLDRFPLEPWKTLSDKYIRSGWQRPWPKYALSCSLWEWRWPAGTPIAPAVPMQNRQQLNLGYYYETPLAGFINAALFPTPGVEAIDLRERWPWEDGAVEHVRAWDIIEHLPDKIFTMNELWRVLRLGGTAEIAVPTTDGSGAFQDPTHVSFWNRRSFLYYEAGNPYHERFAERYGLKARFQAVWERTEVTVDGPRLTILLRAVKGTVGVPPQLTDEINHLLTTTTVLPPGDPRFLCALRVKNESKYIREVVQHVLPLCHHVFVFDDHSTDDTLAICRSFGDRCTVFPSPFTGLDEARDKNYLLRYIITSNPEWVLWIDGDEVLEQGGPARLKAAASQTAGVATYALQIAYAWNDPQHIRVDGVYGRFARPSFFCLKGQPLTHLHFQATGRGANLHCGNVPRGLVGRVQTLNVRLKHYGYMTPEQRRAKYTWYTTIDPNNAAEDNYRHLAEIPGARHAPGPPQIVPWIE